MGGREIAHVIFEHRGAMRGKTVAAEDPLERGAFGFGQIARMFDAIDRIEKAVEPAGGEHAFGIGGGAVGIDNAPPRQGADRGGQSRIGAERVEGDVVDRLEIGEGV